MKCGCHSSRVVREKLNTNLLNDAAWHTHIMKIKIIFFFLLALFPQGSLAVDEPREGDPILGQAKAAAMACLVCHGLDDTSKYPSIPILAGQHPRYIVRQIKSFQYTSQGRTGLLSDRGNILMGHQVAALSDIDILDIAAFFGHQKCHTTVMPKLQSQAISPGISQLAVRCLACHGGAGGTGQYSLVPKLFGQNRLYLQNQLSAFYDGVLNISNPYSESQRHHRIMSRQNKYLTEEDIIGLATYFASIPCQ